MRHKEMKRGSTFYKATDAKIIRHKNPSGKVTWHRATFIDERGQLRCSPRYHGKCSITRKCAQNWLYATTRIWCKIMTIEQRVVGPDGKSIIVNLGQEEIF